MWSWQLITCACAALAGVTVAAESAYMRCSEDMRGICLASNKSRSMVMWPHQQHQHFRLDAECADNGGMTGVRVRACDAGVSPALRLRRARRVDVRRRSRLRDNASVNITVCCMG